MRVVWWGWLGGGWGPLQFYGSFDLSHPMITCTTTGNTVTLTITTWNRACFYQSKKLKIIFLTQMFQETSEEHLPHLSLLEILSLIRVQNQWCKNQWIQVQKMAALSLRDLWGFQHSHKNEEIPAGPSQVPATESLEMLSGYICIQSLNDIHL